MFYDILYSLIFTYLEQGHWQKEASEGTWSPSGQDDVLSRATGKKEHPGRVRGVGVGSRIRKYFGNSNRDREDHWISKAEFLAYQKQSEDRMQQMMKNLLKSMGMQLPEGAMEILSTPPLQQMHSSCQSIDPNADPFAELEVEKLM